MNTPAGRIYFGRRGPDLCIRATGRVTAPLCSSLHGSVNAELAGTDRAQRARVDLSGCEHMDSTFIGLLVGLSRRLGGEVAVERPSPACRSALEDLGLLEILQIPETPSPFPNDLELQEPGSTVSADLLLETHTALSETSEENRARFALLRKMLENRPPKS
jgi:anti-anti-sigma regulatory factor